MLNFKHRLILIPTNLKRKEGIFPHPYFILLFIKFIIVETTGCSHVIPGYPRIGNHNKCLQLNYIHNTITFMPHSIIIIS